MSDVNNLVRRCPSCHNIALHYLFSVGNHRLVECTECDLLMINPQPSEELLKTIYQEQYGLDNRPETEMKHVSELRRATARSYLGLIKEYGATEGDSLLEIGFGCGDFLVEAEMAGYNVTGVEYSASCCEVAKKKLSHEAQLICGTIESLSDASNYFDVCVLSDVIEHIRDPGDLLRQVHAVLKPDGIILIATPTTESVSAKWMRSQWVGFKEEHLFYFKASNLESLLFHGGFDSVVALPGKKTVSIKYITEHLRRFPRRLITSAGNWLEGILPERLLDKPFQAVASGIIVLARARKPFPVRRKLSLIVPAFNEARTFKPAVEKILAKEIDDLEMETVIVESNSTDGTRELVLNYQDDPRVKLVLEECPRGKGFAVRNGLRHATGDFVMIQDADLEYDLEDYESLLEPLISGKKAFVLGARHGGNKWKMRSFKGRYWTTLLYNAGHWLFVGFFDLLYWVRLKDPTTMYKVFRRDCLYGLEFECNRFDFDWELVTKLIRKGHLPSEIPVNYRSRTMDEGKKVDTLRDPWTWFKAIIRNRFVRIDPLRQISKIAEREKLDDGTGG